MSSHMIAKIRMVWYGSTDRHRKKHAGIHQYPCWVSASYDTGPLHSEQSVAGLDRVYWDMAF